MAKTQKKVLVGIDSKIIIDPETSKTYVSVTLNYQNGEVESKRISFEDYCTWLLNAKKEEISYTHIGCALPKYFLDGMQSNEKDTFKVMLLIPAGKHQMVSQNFDFAESIPYPALLFKLSFSKGKSTQKECYAVVPDKNGKLNDDSPLYRYPYGNVSSEGSICMGNIAVRCDDISQADRFAEEFFLGIDEGHYYSPETMISKDWNLGKLYNEAMKKDAFPKSWLVPNGRTYGNIKFK